MIKYLLRYCRDRVTEEEFASSASIKSCLPSNLKEHFCSLSVSCYYQVQSSGHPLRKGRWPLNRGWPLNMGSSGISVYSNTNNSWRLVLPCHTLKPITVFFSFSFLFFLGTKILSPSNLRHHIFHRVYIVRICLMKWIDPRQESH